MGQMMGAMGNKDVMDPSQAAWGDLDTSEKSARIGGNALRGLGQGVTNYQQQNAAMRNRGGMMPQFGGGGDPTAPQFSAQNLPGGGADPRARNPYFFGYGQ